MEIVLFGGHWCAKNHIAVKGKREVQQEKIGDEEDWEVAK